MNVLRFISSLVAVVTISFLGVTQTQGAIVLLPVTENLDNDASWTHLKWIQVAAGKRAWLGSDLFPDPGVNDTFEVTVPVGFVGMVDVTDVGTPGEEYEVLGISTSTVPDGVAVNNSPSSTFASPVYSSGTITLPASPVPYVFNVDLTEEPAVGDVGGVWIRYRTGTVIPEPATGLLMMAGAALLLFTRRRSP